MIIIYIYKLYPLNNISFSIMIYKLINNNNNILQVKQIIKIYIINLSFPFIE